MVAISASSAASKTDGAGFTLPLNHNKCYRKLKYEKQTKGMESAAQRFKSW